MFRIQNELGKYLLYFWALNFRKISKTNFKLTWDPLKINISKNFFFVESAMKFWFGTDGLFKNFKPMIQKLCPKMKKSFSSSFLILFVGFFFGIKSEMIRQMIRWQMKNWLGVSHSKLISLIVWWIRTKKKQLSRHQKPFDQDTLK